MGLSRLNQFLRNVRGTLLHVDPNAIDATDSIENTGTSPVRPFRSLQRALAESARYSFQPGLDNDRFNKTTILLAPGTHIIDNRPGWIPDGPNNFRLRNGSASGDYREWDLSTNFDVTSENNALYKLNSVHGGLIIPRGTSIVGTDLRKTMIRPLYVPNPENDNIPRSCVFRVTGACYFWQFTILDADPNGLCYKDYTPSLFVPNFSHHKLSGFEYADGVNPVKIEDTFQTFETSRTDLDIYYEKIGLAYGQSSGRPITPDYPDSVEIQPVIDEYRIVGSRGAAVGISSIRSGDGINGSKLITVTLSEPFNQVSVDTPIQISGVNAEGYNGQFVVASVIDDTNLQYAVSNIPPNPLPGIVGASLNIAVDTVTSASPYIFNISLRSVYGMCGLLSDGSKADGFKSMVVAQYTGIGLQKDDNAFVKYDTTSGSYKDSTGFVNLHSDSRARFKPSYENFHIRAINDAYLQLVSVFAIGYAQHFSVESGGDFSINNSNSNFGSKALVASGFRRNAFPQDDTGYITHIVGPREIETEDITISFSPIDVDKTITIGVAATDRLYLYDEILESNPPESLIDGYRIGAKRDDLLFVELAARDKTEVGFARIIMNNTGFTSNEVSSEKIALVGRSAVGINSITNNTFTLTRPHIFENGETIRVISENGHVPDGIQNNEVYYAITNEVEVGIGSNQIRLAQNLNDAVNNNPITINEKGGRLSIISRVSDKSSGEIGHPVQWDSVKENWYINVATASTENTLYPALYNYSVQENIIKESTSRSYIRRNPDDRSLNDTVYKVRFVIPNDTAIAARPPLDGYIIQESNNVLGAGTTEIQKLFSTNLVALSNPNEFRNFKFIADANWSGNTANIITELPHNLSVGSEVEVLNILSSNNPTGIASSAFNGTHTIIGINSSRHFSYTLNSNPGTFANDVDTRNEDLPYVKRKKLGTTYQVYRSEEIQKYQPGFQDGVYDLIVINSTNSPTVTPFVNLNFSQPVSNLYPQVDRDNPISDALESKCFALPDPIGKVDINEPQNSITKETLFRQFTDFGVGFAVTDIRSSSGIAHTLYTNIDHGLCGITSVVITSPGTGYTTGLHYNARLVGSGSSTGLHATARVSVSVGGTVTNVTIMDGGSAYKVGDTLQIVNIPGTSIVPASVVVTNIYDHVGECLAVTGVSSFTGYNTLYRITGVNTSNQINVQSSQVVGLTTSGGIGANLTAGSNVVLTGTTLGITTFTYDHVSGIGTLNFNRAHGFRVNNKLRIGGADNTLFNDEFIVRKLNTNTSVSINVGINTLPQSTGGNITVYRPSLNSRGGNLNQLNKLTSGRLLTQYAGITTTLGVNFLSNNLDTDPIIIPNADILGLRIGDYIQVDDEIMRVKSSYTGSSVPVYRKLFGTPRQTHLGGTQVRKISVLPVEFRRNSIIRASGHTFEYLGYGPGNYSTAFPERQDRVLSSQETLFAQSFKTDGGVSIYTGMDDRGNFYTGNKKLNSTTGKEEIYDTPFPTKTGEDPSVGTEDVSFDIVSTQEVSATRSIKVEGGTNGNIISEFNGPVVFNNKITSTSEKGIEAKSIYLQGDAPISRKHTVGIGSTPTVAGNTGDVIYKEFPKHTDYMGWVYTTSAAWEPFGYVGTLPPNIVAGTFHQVLYKNQANDQSGNPNFLYKDNTTLIVGAGDSTGTANQRFQLTGNSYFSDNVGIGTTVPRSKLHVLGNATIVGVVTAPTFVGALIGNASSSTNVSGGTGDITTLRVAGISTFTNGNVLIGSVNSTGVANQRLQVTGGGYFSGTLGVGTSTPLATLHVVSTQTATADAPIARLLAPNLSNPATTGIAIGRQFGTGINFQSTLFSYNYRGNTAFSGSYLAISHAGQGNTLVVADSNRVGIKTATPQSDLHVVGDTRTTGQFIGNGTIPIGGIIMWSGSIGSIPVGWRICDGGSSTPDLRDRFVVGAGNNYVVGATGGSANAIVVSHTHTASSASAGSHTHTGTTDSQGSHTHTATTSVSHDATKWWGDYGVRGPWSGAEGLNVTIGHAPASVSVSVTNASNGAHTHTLNIDANGSHSHAVTVDTAGSSGTNANLPPYYALAFIMRIA
jgi:hypothetical protein